MLSLCLKSYAGASSSQDRISGREDEFKAGESLDKLMPMSMSKDP